MLFCNGWNATTGQPLLPSMTPDQVAALACGELLDGRDVEAFRRLRSRREDHLDACFGVDTRDLAATGWGAIFPEARRAELRDALSPLLDLRRAQAGRLREQRYRELVHYRDEPKGRFLARHRMGPGPADPDRLPYYLLIVGSPEEISFRFQYQLDLQYAVGRICFDSLEDYARYAESVVAAEQGRVQTDRSVCFFGVSNPGDTTTASCLHHLVEPLATYAGRDPSQWRVDTVLGEAATKAALTDLLGGPATPSFLFTASHGLAFEPSDSRHLPHQGALLCQDWPGPESWRGRLLQDHYLAGEDIADSATVAGLIAFFFACYGAGTPTHDEFEMEGEPSKRLAAEGFVSRLPQRLLAHPRGGALAVVGHVDRAWTFSFDWPEAGVQTQLFESVLGRLLDGYPVGAACEYFSQRYAELYADFAEERERLGRGGKPDVLDLSRLWVTARDARSYAVIGDPAVRLRGVGPARG